MGMIEILKSDLKPHEIIAKGLNLPPENIYNCSKVYNKMELYSRFKMNWKSRGGDCYARITQPQRHQIKVYFLLAVHVV